MHDQIERENNIVLINLLYETETAQMQECPKCDGRGKSKVLRRKCKNYSVVSISIPIQIENIVIDFSFSHIFERFHKLSKLTEKVINVL